MRPTTTQERINKKLQVLICNSFRMHKTLEILNLCFKNDIIQPRNVAVFASLKVAYREQVDRLERGGVNTISKHYPSL